MKALEIRNLRKEYDGFTLNNISFDIPVGYIMGFVGENGAGKTTTIKSLLNVVNRDGGTIKIFGKDIDEHEIEIKENIGYVSGDQFYPKKKLKEITNVYRRFFKRWDEEVYRSYLKEFNLDENKKIEELSKGMSMKYTIALALSHHAELLILDEPTSGLDPVARDNLLEVFQTLVEEGNVSILYSTHITTDLQKCADYITFIQNGELLESCSVDELLEKYKLVNGSTEALETMKSNMISYRENSFGFNGLILSENVKEISGVRYGQATIDDIIIYFSEKVK